MTVNALYPTVSPSLDLNFVRSGVLDSRVTFTRASTGTSFNSLGTLTTALTNVPRLDFNPSTLAAQGLLIEEARTNSIRNNTMVGAVAGTPGTLPTNWIATSTLTGLTREIVGTGTESGISYIDVRLSGTPSSSGTYLFLFETSTSVAALNGQTWTISVYSKLQAGSLAGVTSARLYFQENNSGGGYITEQNTAITNPTSAALSTQRASATRTLNQATTAFLSPGFNLLLTGVAIDITLRIGLPQLEQGAFATSVIPTSTVAVTRAADVASVNTLTPWYNAVEGTLFAEYAVNATSYNAGVAAFSDGTFNNRMVIRGMTPSNESLSLAATGGVSQWNNAFSSQTTAVTKWALAYKANDIAFTRNAATPLTDASATIPTVNQLRLGADADGSILLGGYLRRVSYYPVRLTNANLQAITT